MVVLSAESSVMSYESCRWKLTTEDSSLMTALSTLREHYDRNQGEDRNADNG